MARDGENRITGPGRDPGIRLGEISLRTLGVSKRCDVGTADGEEHVLAEASDRPICPRPASVRRTDARTPRGKTRSHSPGLPRSHRSATHSRSGYDVPCRPVARLLRQGRRRAPCLAAIRRTLGTALAGCRALQRRARRISRLRRVARSVALPGLGCWRLKSRPAL